MRVAEVFGPTVQGEGPSCGEQATFVRLWGCNLDCSWCDTPYTWDTTGKNGTLYVRSEESREVDVVSLLGEIPDLPRLVVITGGEPLIQAADLEVLVDVLVARGHRVEIETNGTRPPLRGPVRHTVRYNVSPKLAHAGTTKEAIRPDRLQELARTGYASFKFVARTVTNLAEIAVLVDRCGLLSSDVWVMPEGRDAGTIVGRLEGLADEVVARGWNLSPRLHVLCWGDKRGV